MKEASTCCRDRAKVDKSICMNCKFKVDKLIRDKMPDILRKMGVSVSMHIMNHGEYIQALKKKLIEEAREVFESKTEHELCEELADIMEVVLTLTEASGFQHEQIEQRRLQKKEAKGGFEKRVYNAFIEMPANNKAVEYYRAKPEEYPEITTSKCLEHKG